MYGQYGNCNHGGYCGGRGGRGRGYGRDHGGRNTNQSNIDDPNCILPPKPTLTNKQVNKIKVKCRPAIPGNVREAMIISFDRTVPYNKELLL